eukprot:scaffold7133_cov147-Isochrysis_galbana.AAC.4
MRTAPALNPWPAGASPRAPAARQAWHPSRTWGLAGWLRPHAAATASAWSVQRARAPPAPPGVRAAPLRAQGRQGCARRGLLPTGQPRDR